MDFTGLFFSKRRLSREDIPLVGRILALADCYDALTSVRPYKPAWPHHTAVTHVSEQRGLAFDPRLVDAFLAREHQFDAIRGAPSAAAVPRTSSRPSRRAARSSSTTSTWVSLTRCT